MRNNRMFWIGFQTSWLIGLIIEFINGKSSWRHTMLWGTITILCIGLDRVLLEQEEKQ